MATNEMLNRAVRALHMPPGRLLRKLSGCKELYTVAVRPVRAENPLPALGRGEFVPLPYRPDVWYADPMLFSCCGERYLFCEAFDRPAGRGRIDVFTFGPDGLPCAPQTALQTDCHLSFPFVFSWNDEIWMLPETSGAHTLELYHCKEFPLRWEAAQKFPVGCELCDTILLDCTPNSLRLLCSETNPENQLFVRWRHFVLERTPAAESGFSLREEDTAQTAFDLVSRNAGPLFSLGGQLVHPTQVSTRADYGVYLQFFAVQQGRETPLCAATPQTVRIRGLAEKDIVGIHTYCRDDAVEVIDARYLKKE